MLRLPLRPPLREPLRDAFLRAGNISQAIRALFANNQQGVWYDPSDFSTLFQDSAGATPVTAVEQPVGLMRDKSGRNNHASQITAASRPVVSARVNLLTKTEQFDDAAWVKTGCTVSANVLIPSAVAEVHHITQALSSTTQGVFVEVVVEKQSTVDKVTLYPGGAATFCHFNLTAMSMVRESGVTSSTIEALSGNQYKLTAAWPAGVAYDRLRVYASSGSEGASAVAGDGTSGVKLIRAQLNAGTATRYQRVNTAGDYDTAGFPMYLRFDGVDDGMLTAAVNFTATDKMTAWAGVRKLGDTLGIVAELSAGAGANNGGFYVVSGNDSGAGYSTLSKGDAAAVTGHVGQFLVAAPHTAVLTAIHDIVGDLSRIRVNGVNGTDGIADKGLGNFGNHPLFIGRRNNVSLPLNGNLYGLIIRGAASSAAEIAVTERYVANKTGVTL